VPMANHTPGGLLGGIRHIRIKVKCMIDSGPSWSETSLPPETGSLALACHVRKWSRSSATRTNQRRGQTSVTAG